MNSVTPLNPQKAAETPLRFVTAASLFDGHDASINIMRRILQGAGVEVIHLAHNRAVDDVVRAALNEDVDGIAISSYQGGHVEYFRYLIDRLNEEGAGHIRVFGGGGGVIVATEIEELEAHGVERIYSPQAGQSMGLVGMIDDMIQRTHKAVRPPLSPLSTLEIGNFRQLAQAITAAECELLSAADAQWLAGIKKQCPVLGITGTGGAGKSSLTDEVIRRFRLDAGDSLRIGVVAIDPTRRKTGGALLGDRIRMNAIDHDAIFFRSLATRGAAGELPAALPDVLSMLHAANFDLIIVETPGIGQGDSAIEPYVDTSMYVMTPEFGAQSQLEKIDMLDYADIIIINKFDRQGADDALRDVAKQVQRNRAAFDKSPDDMPVFGSIASRFNDDGVTAAYQCLLAQLREKGLKDYDSRLPRVATRTSTNRGPIVPPERKRYLAEIADTVRGYHAWTEIEASKVSDKQALSRAQALLDSDDAATLSAAIEAQSESIAPEATTLLEQWSAIEANYRGAAHEVEVRGKVVRNRLRNETLSGTVFSRVALPRYTDHGDLLRWLRRDNLPGYFPYTAGVFPFKREGEDPARMFAGEGDPFRTNRRFKQLCEHAPAKRLSTAFDSVTLYGCDPALRPDIYGKIGNAGVSIATLDDMKALYDGFDLCDPTTSVSMTINGPAPTVLAMFLTTAIDQRIEKFTTENGREPNLEERAAIQAETLSAVRGTVQADILKEDQGQNTCIFSTEFSLRVMGDIQQYFIENDVRNFYSVSISGYHIAEAGANPISQLAFTLANGFTFVEAYLARGMNIDDFAPNLSFFFSNGMDPEYTVIGRVARRIWATVLRDKYGADARSQRLKYHIQTSGRSLHAQEMNFNDIRTTLQALIAVYDNCNSLHTNAYDEAITTPTEESVRRALAIQLIINREFGLARNENPNQGSFVIDELTDLVEEAVLVEFERISDRGGVLGAMETGYQRGKIQDESMHYEHKKHDGSLPIIGVNTFLADEPEVIPEIELARSTEDEKRNQIQRVEEFRSRHADASGAALSEVQRAAGDGDNVFAALMQAVRVCSLGQITDALFAVGGQYRRTM